MTKKRKTVLEMNEKELKRYLLKPSSYCTFNLPKYFDFSDVLKQADKILKHNSEDLNKVISEKENKEIIMTDINYNLVMNKDGLYDWRPLSLIHPVAYVGLVDKIKTEWKVIVKRFDDFQKDSKIKCISIPVESTNSHSDKAETILNWWENLEQASIAYSLEYMYCIKTDITNCYGSIYTHTISWAIYGKEKAKKKKKKGSIDRCIQSIQNGQTNGIPQGSVVFDIIAEIILGYADELLSKEIKLDVELDKEDFKIIRYRDDYRIFSNKKEVSEKILRKLSDVLADLNMHFNSKKTKMMDDVIINSVKDDKLDWTITDSSLKTLPINKDDSVIYHLSLQKHLLQIYKFQKKHPNSGSLIKALNSFMDRIQRAKKLPNDYRQILGILINIVVSSPKTVPIGMAIISNILMLLEGNSNEVEVIIKKIIERLKNIPNSGFIEIWLQRLSILVDKGYEYSDQLCKKIYNKNQIWKSDWFDENFNEDTIINEEYINNMKIKINREDVDIFYSYIRQ